MSGVFYRRSRKFGLPLNFMRWYFCSVRFGAITRRSMVKIPGVKGKVVE
jgi:hypothetical protein